MSQAFVLGVDLDGVCGDHTAAFRRVVAAETGCDPADLPDQRDWSFTEWGIGPEEFDRLHRIAVLEHRMFRDMPPIEGVAEALWRLSDIGVWIRLITHRLYVNWGHAVAVADTVSWLDLVGIPYRDICFLGNKPQVEADVYVDDAPRNITELRAEGNAVIVFDQPYNADMDGPRVKDWNELETLVEAMLSGRGPVQAPLSGFPSSQGRLPSRGTLRSAPLERP